jgi:hypothetical protein
MLNLIFLALLLALLIFLAIFWTFQISYTISQDKIGFLPSLSGKLNLQLLRIFDQYLHDPKDYSFVELGAGVANIAGFINKNFEFKEVIAVEIDPITVFFGKLINNISGTNVEFIRKDIFAYKIPQKSVLYCYLSTHIMEKMLRQGKFDGHLVVSTTFKLKKTEPVEIIEMNNFYMRMYVYDFRKKEDQKQLQKEVKNESSLNQKIKPKNKNLKVLKTEQKNNTTNSKKTKKTLKNNPTKIKSKITKVK